MPKKRHKRKSTKSSGFGGSIPLDIKDDIHERFLDLHRKLQRGMLVSGGLLFVFILVFIPSMALTINQCLIITNKDSYRSADFKVEEVYRVRTAGRGGLTLFLKGKILGNEEVIPGDKLSQMDAKNIAGSARGGGRSTPEILFRDLPEITKNDKPKRLRKVLELAVLINPEDSSGLRVLSPQSLEDAPFTLIKILLRTFVPLLLCLFFFLRYRRQLKTLEAA